MKVKNLNGLLAISLGRLGEGLGFGRFSPDKVGADPAGSLAKFISFLIGFLTITAGLWFSVKFILGALSWISAGSNVEAVKGAHQTMLNAVIGLIIVVAGLAIISIVGTVLGFPILDLGTLLNNLGGNNPAPVPTP